MGADALALRELFHRETGLTACWNDSQGVEYFNISYVYWVESKHLPEKRLISESCYICKHRAESTIRVMLDANFPYCPRCGCDIRRD